ncbi:MAG: hypothetical protein DRH04_01895 [Deltaproteobacteria bacterium]|nr:MAG: hypothetical protein DRH04_01895 [Deltaproteobacteria bacterium]
MKRRRYRKKSPFNPEGIWKIAHSLEGSKQFLTPREFRIERDGKQQIWVKLGDKILIEKKHLQSTFPAYSADAKEINDSILEEKVNAFLQKRKHREIELAGYICLDKQIISWDWKAIFVDPIGEMYLVNAPAADYVLRHAREVTVAKANTTDVLTGWQEDAFIMIACCTYTDSIAYAIEKLLPAHFRELRIYHRLAT